LSISAGSKSEVPFQNGHLTAQRLENNLRSAEEIYLEDKHNNDSSNHAIPSASPHRCTPAFHNGRAAAHQPDGSRAFRRGEESRQAHQRRPRALGGNDQLQFTASLAPPAWTNAQASQPGTGAVLTFTDPSGATNKTARYYRIRLVP
jgi:hypothetical protein